MSQNLAPHNKRARRQRKKSGPHERHALVRYNANIGYVLEHLTGDKMQPDCVEYAGYGVSFKVPLAGTFQPDADVWLVKHPSADKTTYTVRTQKDKPPGDCMQLMRHLP